MALEELKRQFANPDQADTMRQGRDFHAGFNAGRKAGPKCEEKQIPGLDTSETYRYGFVEGISQAETDQLLAALNRQSDVKDRTGRLHPLSELQ